MKFGFNSADLESIARSLEAVLNVRFILHDSSFRGGNYYLADAPQLQVILQSNHDILDEEPFEPGWPKNRAILYVDTPDAEGGRSFAEAVQKAALQSGATPLSKDSEAGR